MLINVETARDAREALRAAHSWLWAQLQDMPDDDAKRRQIEIAKDHVEEAVAALRGRA